MQNPLRFYRERKSGDYLVADWSSRLHDGSVEGRATAIEGNFRSVATTGIDPEYLHRKCRRVDRGEVPPEWLAMLG